VDFFNSVTDRAFNKRMQYFLTLGVQPDGEMKNIAAQIYKEEMFEYNPGQSPSIPTPTKKRKLIIVPDDEDN